MVFRSPLNPIVRPSPVKCVYCEPARLEYEESRNQETRDSQYIQNWPRLAELGRDMSRHDKGRDHDMPKYHIRGEQYYEQNGKPETCEKVSQFTPALAHSNRVYGYRIHMSRAKLSVSVLIWCRLNSDRERLSHWVDCSVKTPFLDCQSDVVKIITFDLLQCQAHISLSRQAVVKIITLSPIVSIQISRVLCLAWQSHRIRSMPDSEYSRILATP